jgi:hypothetical protein
LDQVPHETQDSITAWADATFGPVPSSLSVWRRADKEWRELGAKLEQSDDYPGAAEECADVVIVLMRMFSRLRTEWRREVDRKMSINRTREWVLTEDGHGQHVPSGAESAKDETK